jgi:hypothetical protein
LASDSESSAGNTDSIGNTAVAPTALSIRFGPDVPQTVRRRIDYAFRVFSATFGFVPRPSSEVRLCYGADAERSGDVVLAVGYRARELSEPAPAPSWVALPAGLPGALPAEHPCFHRLGADGDADWLGEIFEWISASHENAVEASDSVGRIPFGATLHGKYALTPEVPYAAVAMHVLNLRIREVVGGGWPQAPVRPWAGEPRWVVAATHDVDFLHVSIPGTLWRYVKNLMIGCVVYRSPRLVGSVLRHAAGALFGGPSLFTCLKRLREEEARRGITSTFLFQCRRGHPRDANYDLAHPRVIDAMQEIAESGGEVGVHGTYTSLDAPGRLLEEFRRLAQLGFRPIGNRQHWLRYRDSSLLEELVEAGAWYDGTAGYSERPGFRQGMCSPFPPYDFKRERAFELLELPLAIMDGAVYSADPSGRTWQERCQRILDISRALGWGGVSVLWHDSLFSGAQLPIQLADLYWDLPKPGDRWTTARDVVLRAWPRFAQAGLLPENPPPPPPVNSAAASA